MTRLAKQASPWYNVNLQLLASGGIRITVTNAVVSHILDDFTVLRLHDCSSSSV